LCAVLRILVVIRFVRSPIKVIHRRSISPCPLFVFRPILLS
uniref:Uncharacterized protein n=1 Tax=Haemonchus placei TaxID=6290 RepID=A0A0N4WY66_HAEPC